MMDIGFSKLYQQSSKDFLKGHPPIPVDYTKWPAEWTTVYYKVYKRFDSIALERSAQSPADVFELLKNRRSRNSFREEPLSLGELSVILEYGCGITLLSFHGAPHIMHRTHPSGGGLFPIEIYPLVLRNSEHVPSGVYHYNIKDHALDMVWKRSLDASFVQTLITCDYPWVANAGCILLFTAIFPQIEKKYGEIGYRFILLEAGHIGQNIYLVAEALGLKCNALGAVRSHVAEDLLDIDGVTEGVVYTLVLGK